MNSTLAHRGPDDSGVLVFENAALANSRLSVIDLDTGHQPISNEDKTRWIIHNGEVYNFFDLRQELEKLGHSFRTQSDTEVVLHAYEQWGIECVHRFKGMFAFAIFDFQPQERKNPQLFIARDRVGKKPLYYYQDADNFIFASEIKALLAHPAVSSRVNRQVIPLYLAYGYVPAPFTILEAIYELPPGHFLTIQDSQVAVREYWDVTYPSDSLPRPSEEKIVGQLGELLEEAVRIRLISDVPIGAFLSGGIDSTAIVASMAQLMDQPVKTFAIGFEDDPSFNELEYARLVANTYDTAHHEFVVQSNTVDLLPQLVWHYDQPFADSSAIPTYLLSKLTRDSVTVALTGDGGDELFAGYDRFTAARLAQAYQCTPRFIKHALAHLFDVLPESTSYYGFVRRARSFMENAPLPLPQRYLGWVGVFSDSLIYDLLSNGIELDPVEHFQSYFNRMQELDTISQLLYVNTKTYLPGDLLVKTDRMTMANSLEARCPFLDHELIEFAARIPSGLKLSGMTTKYILKKSLEDIVPKEIIHRKKHGFGVPVGHWFKTSLKDYVREVILSPQALRRGYFKEEILRKLIEEHQTGRRDHGHRLWALLTFEMWHRVFMDREITP
jgi:asparagine synthase (glutamine-hydrolysing)